MKFLFKVFVILLFPLSVFADSLYTSVINEATVLHFCVSIHPKDLYETGGTSDQSWNYRKVYSFEKIGVSEHDNEYTEYRIMNVDFLDPDINYRIAVMFVYKRQWIGEPLNRWVYSYSPSSKPLYTHPRKVNRLMIKID